MVSASLGQGRVCGKVGYFPKGLFYANNFMVAINNSQMALLKGINCGCVVFSNMCVHK